MDGVAVVEDPPPEEAEAPEGGDEDENVDENKTAAEPAPQPPLKYPNPELDFTVQTKIAV